MSGLFCRAVARGESFPLHCRPALHGGEPAAPGERIPTESARSVEGSKRHRGRLEAHWAPESSFSRLAPGVWLEEQGGSTSAGFRASGGDDRGKPRPGTMPTDRVDDPQIVPWIEKDDLAYYGPFRCVSAPARPARRTTRVQIDAAPTTAVFAREGWRWRKIRFDALSARPRRARVQPPATRERAPFPRTPPRTPTPRKPRPERRRPRRVLRARLASLADANPLLATLSTAHAGTTCVRS